jgi:hypothetical protein
MPDNMYPYGRKPGFYPKYDRADKIQSAEFQKRVSITTDKPKMSKRDKAVLVSASITAATIIPTFGLLFQAWTPISHSVGNIMRIEEKIKNENPQGHELALMKEELIINRQKIGTDSPRRNSYLGLLYVEIFGAVAGFGLRDYLKYKENAKKTSSSDED